MYGSDNYDLLWSGVSGEHETLQRQASLTHAKVAVAQYWPFLSRATSEKDFENRLSLTQDRIAGLVPADSFEDVLASLRDDFRAVAGKGENPFAKDDDEDNDEADNDDKESKDSDSDDDSDDDGDSDDDSKSDDDSDDKSDDDGDSDDDDDDDDKPAFLKGKEATNYRPDPTAGWRYHPGYEQLRAPVNNGDLQDGDGFPTDLAQGEYAGADQKWNLQLTPGQWSQHDGMPERPMPQGQQRGYLPVNASFDKEGFLVETTNVKQSRLVFDADGFVVEASEGRGVEGLQDPAPGTPQRHNPFYFQEGSNVGGNAGFPVDPSAEPLLNPVDDIYGDVAPQQSSGSTEGQVDGQGYSRESSRLGFNRTAADAVNSPEPPKGSTQACSQCGGYGYIDASQWGEPRGTMHPCYRCGTSGQEDAHSAWAHHELERGFAHGGDGLAPEEHASAPYLEGHGKGYEENKFNHHPDAYRVKRDGQEDYHSPGARDHYDHQSEYGDYEDPHFPYRQASFDAEGYLVESPNFT